MQPRPGPRASYMLRFHACGIYPADKCLLFTKRSLAQPRSAQSHCLRSVSRNLLRRAAGVPTRMLREPGQEEARPGKHTGICSVCSTMGHRPGVGGTGHSSSRRRWMLHVVPVNPILGWLRQKDHHELLPITHTHTHTQNKQTNKQKTKQKRKPNK